MNYKRITLLQIEYFIALARLLNFTEAAKSLYISQPSLSKQIAILENEIGAQLFFRTKRDVRLTPAGVVLFKELSGVSESIQGAIEKASQPNLGENSTITIGCLEAMNISKFLPAIIKNFRVKYPGVNMIFERHTFKTLREKLINGTLDVIFTLSFEIDDSLGLLTNIVSRINSNIVMNTSHPLASRKSLKLAELKDEPFVMISRDESPKGFDGIISLCKKHGFAPSIVKQLPNVESLLLCVEMGLGVTLFDSNIRYHDNANFKVFKVDDDTIDVVMAWRRENMNPSIPLFTNNVLSEINL